MLDIPTLTSKARIAHVFPTLGKSLLSVASIYDTDGTATFTKNATVHFDGKIALQGPMDYFTILYHITLSASKPINPAQIIPNDSQT